MMMKPPPNLDPTKIRELYAALLLTAHAYQRQRVAQIGANIAIEYEILNAFAAAVAPFIGGAPAEARERLVAWFDCARDEEIASIVAEDS